MARRWPDALGGFAQINEGLKAQCRHCNGQDPHAHAAPVAKVDDVRHRAHGAEMGFLGNCAEQKSNAKYGDQHQLAHVFQIDFFHDYVGISKLLTAHIVTASGLRLIVCCLLECSEAFASPRRCRAGRVQFND